MKFLLFIQQINIEEKIKKAPDDGYLIGVWIGYLLPFIVLVGFAYLLYYRAKKRQDNK